MPEINELLERAAPGVGGSAPLDDIVRRGRRRQVATRTAAVAAPLAVVAVVATVILTGGGPTGVVIEPGPDVAQSPDPTPTPSEPAEPAEPGEATEPSSGTGDETPAVDTSGWVAPPGLAADALVVAADGNAPKVQRLAADGAATTGDLPDGVPNAAGLLPDGRGGVVWQPDWESAGPAPILHRSADGHVSIVAESPADAEYRLVGSHLDRDAVLVTSLEGTTMETATGDLLAFPIEGGAPAVIGSGVAAWETGVSSAVATDDASLYAVYAEANQVVLLHRDGGTPEQIYLAGEATGENLAGVGVLDDGQTGVVLVSGMTGLDRPVTARLLFVDLDSGEITNEVDVPLGLGPDSDAAWPGATARDLSVRDGHVLVNRWFEGEWVAPLVHDVEAGTWSLLEHAEAGLVTGRTYLDEPLQDATTAAQAACMTEDGDLVNAEPLIDRISLYLPCKDQTRPGFVNRVPSRIEPTGDVATDLRAAVDRLVEPVLEDDDLVERGYYVPADRGQVVVHSLTIDDGHAVLDLGFPDGMGNLNASFAGTVWHHALRGTVFQFDAIETLEMRLDGSCEAYGEAMQAGPVCIEFDRADAPWNTQGFGA